MFDHAMESLSHHCATCACAVTFILCLNASSACESNGKRFVSFVQIAVARQLPVSLDTEHVAQVR